jgi:aldehyde:ferredoxin oxidoreductase
MDKDEFQTALEHYYQAMGWDDNGVPTPGKIAELGLEWIIEAEDAEKA